MSKAADNPRYYGKLAKVGLVWGFAREWTKALLLLPTAMALARLLTPREAGIAAIAYFFMQLGSRLTQFGLGAALVRTKDLRPEHVSSVFVMNLVLGVSAWFALTFGAPWAGAFFHNEETTRLLPFAAVGFLIMSLGTVPTALLTRDMRYRDSATSDWIGTVVDCSFSVGLAWLGFSYWGLVCGTLVGDLVRALTRAWMVRWRPSLRFTRDAMREMASFGSGNYARSLLEYGSQNLDNLIVGRVLGVTALGFYDKAFSTVARFTARLNVAGPGVSLRVFALIQDEPERFRRAYRKIVLSVTLVSYPLLTGMIVIATPFIEVLLGRQWLAAVAPFQILCGAAMLRVLNTYASTASEAKGYIWSEVKRMTLFVAVLGVAVYAFSPWGIAGAAAGVLLATAVMTCLLQVLVRRLASLHWADILVPQVPAIICSVGLALVIALTRGVVGGVMRTPPPLVMLVAAGCAGGAYYVLFLAFARFGEMRVVVRETAQDLIPAPVKKRLAWLAPLSEDVPALVGQ